MYIHFLNSKNYFNIFHQQFFNFIQFHQCFNRRKVLISSIQDIILDLLQQRIIKLNKT